MSSTPEFPDLSPAALKYPKALVSVAHLQCVYTSIRSHNTAISSRRRKNPSAHEIHAAMITAKEVLHAESGASSANTKSKKPYRSKDVRKKQQEALFRILGDPSKRDGTLFLTDNATDSLYFMLASMDGKSAPDPDFEQEYDDNLLPTRSPAMLPMTEVFGKNIRAVLKAALATGPGKPIYDYVLHRAAFILTTQNVGELPLLWHDAESLVKVAKAGKGKETSLGGAMACEVRKAFEYLELGWDEAVLRNETTYSISEM